MKIAVVNRTTPPYSYVPLPWEVFSEFFRVIWVGCVVTFGPHQEPKTNQVQAPEPDFGSPYIELVNT